jgi:CRISPR-associated endonuclease/helicase Cas3
MTTLSTRQIVDDGQLLQQNAVALLPDYRELSFELIGRRVPGDHSYGLYSALSQLCPALHKADDIRIRAIAGTPTEKGLIALNKNSRLYLRLPAEKVSWFNRLAGRSLTIGNYSLKLGMAHLSFLQPASQLRSRLVLIKGFQDPDAFLDVAIRQLKALSIQGQVQLLPDREGNPRRKTLKIKRHTLVGYGMDVSRLSPQDSLRLQIFGIGDKQKMGCGVFIPRK